MKKLQKFLSLILVFSMVLGMMVFSANAEEVPTGNSWYGDDVKVDVKEGTEGYNYMALFRKPIHGYEFAGHFIGAGEGAQTFVVIDTAKYDGTTWSPNGLFELGQSNYEVMYCCDVETMIVDGTYYKRVNLEDSEYYNAEQAKKIRAIVSNAYPYVSLEDMKAALKEAGFEYAEELTRSEVISAVQAAIWASANNMTAEDFRYVKSYRVTDNYGWGQPVHDISDEAGYDVIGNREFKTYPEVGQRHDALVDYLLALEGAEAETKQIVITKLDITNSKVDNTENQYLVSLNVKLNSGADADDNVVINAYINGDSVASATVGAATNYTLDFNAKENDNIKVVVSGTQNLERGVYFYAPRPADVDPDGPNKPELPDGIPTVREASQNLVGVSMGETAVYAEAEVTLHNGTLEADKDSDNKGNDKFEVSIEVPGGDAEVIHDEIILMVDGSYSGDKEWPAMKEAITSIGKAVLDGSGHTQLTLMAFGMGDNEVLVHIKTVEALEAALGELPGNLLRGVSSTNCEAGFTGVAEYINNHESDLKDAIVIYITDGGINTDETPKLFYNWQAYAPDVNVVIDFALKGVALPEGITQAEKIALVNDLWKAVFELSGMDINSEYPISEMERAFLVYVENGGNVGVYYSFLMAMKYSAFDEYPDVWNRTYNSVFELAKLEEVKELYLVRYKDDDRATWMPEAAAVSETDNIHYVQSNSITTLTDALQETVTELTKTSYTDVTVTDYMSKWVNLIPETLKIVDVSTNTVIWSAAEGWLISEGRPTAQEVPVLVELVDPADYAAGGADVIGNTSGDIYLLTWYVKDGALLRSDNYKLVYEVFLDTDEEGFVFGTDYPANGNTSIHYNGKHTNTIKVPNVTSTTISISGHKTWNDANDQDGKRPDSITINLLANGKEVAEVKTTARDGWQYSFANLPKYENGEQIVYTITEDAVADYTTEIDGFNVTNTHDPEKITVSGSKTWDDADDQDGIRPESITIHLLANGEIIDTKVVTEADDWAWAFANLDRYADGAEIVYTIAEEAVEGYTTTINGYDVTNTHVPEEEEIEEEEVPLGPGPDEAPKTGDASPLALAMMSALVSAALVVLFLIKKRTQVA